MAINCTTMEEIIAFSYVGVLHKLVWEVQEPPTPLTQAYTNHTCMIKCPPNYYRSVDTLDECLPCPGSRFKSWYGSRNHIKRAHDGSELKGPDTCVQMEDLPEYMPGVGEAFVILACLLLLKFCPPRCNKFGCLGGGASVAVFVCAGEWGRAFVYKYAQQLSSGMFAYPAQTVLVYSVPAFFQFLLFFIRNFGKRQRRKFFVAWKHYPVFAALTATAHLVNLFGLTRVTLGAYVVVALACDPLFAALCSRALLKRRDPQPARRILVGSLAVVCMCVHGMYNSSVYHTALVGGEPTWECPSHTATECLRGYLATSCYWKVGEELGHDECLVRPGYGVFNGYLMLVFGRFFLALRGVLSKRVILHERALPGAEKAVSRLFWKDSDALWDREREQDRVRAEKREEKRVAKIKRAREKLRLAGWALDQEELAKRGLLLPEEEEELRPRRRNAHLDDEDDLSDEDKDGSDEELLLGGDGRVLKDTRADKAAKKKKAEEGDGNKGKQLHDLKTLLIHIMGSQSLATGGNEEYDDRGHVVPRVGAPDYAPVTSSFLFEQLPYPIHHMQVMDEVYKSGACDDEFVGIDLTSTLDLHYLGGGWMLFPVSLVATLASSPGKIGEMHTHVQQAPVAPAFALFYIVLGVMLTPFATGIAVFNQPGGVAGQSRRRLVGPLLAWVLGILILDDPVGDGQLVAFTGVALCACWAALAFASAWRRREQYTWMKVVEEGLYGLPPAVMESLHECASVADPTVFKQVMIDVVWNYRDYRLNHIETPAQSSGSDVGLSSSGSGSSDENTEEALDEAARLHKQHVEEERRERLRRESIASNRDAELDELADFGDGIRGRMSRRANSHMDFNKKRGSTRTKRKKKKKKKRTDDSGHSGPAGLLGFLSSEKDRKAGGIGDFDMMPPMSADSHLGHQGALDLQRRAAMEAARARQEAKELAEMSTSSEDPDVDDITDDEDGGDQMKQQQRPDESLCAARKRRKRARERKRRRLELQEKMVGYRKLRKNHENEFEHHFELE